MLYASRSWITGCTENCVPLAADADGCVVIERLFGAPAVTLIEFELTPVNDPDEKRSVRVPVTPEMTRLLNVAMPFAFVVAESVPPSEPLPIPMAAVTTTPA